MSATRQVSPMAEEWLIQATIAAAAPAGTVTPATIQRMAGDAPAPAQQAPFSEVWHIEDFYYEGANPAPDVQIRLLVNNVAQKWTPLASSVNIANLYKARLPLTLVVTRGGVVRCEMLNIAVVGGVAITVVFKARVMVKPVE